MKNTVPDNLIEVDSLVDSFLKEHEQGIITMHRLYFKDESDLSLRALIAELKDELRTGCVTFINKERPMGEIGSYLFYIANDFCKKRATPLTKKKTDYLCPGCLFLGKDNFVDFLNKIFKCDECEGELRQADSPKNVMFFRTFFRHNKIGYHCRDCDRFIPHPLDNSPIISCPYFDCYFVGDWSALKRMYHPSSQSNVEFLTLDGSQDGKPAPKDLVPACNIDIQSQMEIQEALDDKVTLLREVIDHQNNNVPYSSSDFTIKHKCLVYQSFDNLLKKHPIEMVDYLLNQSRSGGFQHKVFQEYTKLLEASIPFMFKRNNKLYMINSLLDENLGVFEGMSVFDAIITDKLAVKNNTQEFYIGGRKAKVTKPYYIGKLLNIINKKTKEPIMDHVIEYSFSLIKLKEVKPGTEVTVTHLRVPPHYQMGGMVYVNRVRKKIVDRAQLLLQKEDI